MAQEKIGKNLEALEQGGKPIEFKEIFKWVCSPLIAESLGIPANMDGLFQIHVSFSLRDSQIYLE